MTSFAFKKHLLDSFYPQNLDVTEGKVMAIISFPQHSIIRLCLDWFILNLSTNISAFKCVWINNKNSL